MSKATILDIKCCKCGADAKSLLKYSDLNLDMSIGNYYLSGTRVRTIPRKEVWEVRVCENCGYMNPNLSIDNGLSLSFFNDLTTDDIVFKSKHAELLYKYHKVLRTLTYFENAYYILMACLDECDYVGDRIAALYCLMKMNFIYDKISKPNVNIVTQQIDVCRRLGLFEKTKSLVNNIDLPKEVFLVSPEYQNLLDYQVYLAENEKDGLYTHTDMQKWLEGQN